MGELVAEPPRGPALRGRGVSDPSVRIPRSLVIRGRVTRNGRTASFVDDVFSHSRRLRPIARATVLFS